jgi:hypothetical protein
MIDLENNTMDAEQEPARKIRKAPKGRPELARFAQTLNKAMRQRGMSPSDLAREVFGSHTDIRGYSVARNRDRIGAYLAGISYPQNSETLRKLAEALGLRPEMLALNPVGVASIEETDTPDLVITSLPNGMARIEMRRVVPMQSVPELVGLLEEIKARLENRLAEIGIEIAGVRAKINDLEADHREAAHTD